MAQLGQSKAELVKSGAAIFAISNEDGAALKKTQSQHKLDFITFLSDKKGEAAKKYAGTYPNQTMLQPATFVIGKDKKIVYSYVNEDFRLRAQTDAVIAALKKLK
jgi:peroxiredoxin